MDKSKSIRQLRFSSHKLEIQVGQALSISRVQRFYKLIEGEIKSKEGFVCECPTFNHIREKFATPAIWQIMEKVDP